MQTQHSRIASFVICFFVYAIAFTVAYAFVFFYTGDIHTLSRVFVGDLLATITVFAFSVIFKNASLYDPYWSVAPPVMCIYLMNGMYAHEVQLIMLLCVTLWAIRLTLNWARGWQGLVHEDWRYKMLHDKNPKLYWITNLGGIHLFPTVMVFLGLLPVYYVFSKDMFEFDRPNAAINYAILVIGIFISLMAVLVELLADEQMHTFKKSARPGEFIETGLWKYSRHPNYFGEIMFWFGLWVMQMSITPGYWWTGIGFIAMFIMFWYASIPMMEEKPCAPNRVMQPT